MSFRTKPARSVRAEADLKFILCNSVSSSGVDKWARQLLDGRHTHDVLEACLREIEEEEKIESVGYGGFPNIVGEMELECSFSIFAGLRGQ